MTTPISAEERARKLWRQMSENWRGAFAVGKIAEQIRQAEAAAEQRGYRRGLKGEAKYHAKEAASWERVSGNMEKQGKVDAMHQADTLQAYHESQEERLQEDIRALAKDSEAV